MNDSYHGRDTYQGRGKAPDVGPPDIVFAVLLGWIFYELLMAWMES